jgi:hypothetical protein
LRAKWMRGSAFSSAFAIRASLLENGAKYIVPMDRLQYRKWNKTHAIFASTSESSAPLQHHLKSVSGNTTNLFALSTPFSISFSE